MKVVGEVQPLDAAQKRPARRVGEVLDAVAEFVEAGHTEPAGERGRSTGKPAAQTAHGYGRQHSVRQSGVQAAEPHGAVRAEERRVGKGWVRTCRTRGARSH